jgi:hypothetical protein
MRYAKFAYSLVLFLLLASASCTVSVSPGYIAEDKTNTEIAIDKFHQRLDEGKYEDIYNDAYPAFQQSQSKEALIDDMRRTHEKYGKMVEVTGKVVNVIVGAPVQIRAIYNTRFEKGDATEMFNFVKSGDSVKLALYRVSDGTSQLPTL